MLCRAPSPLKPLFIGMLTEALVDVEVPEPQLEIT
jgi:hypothetical protein